MAVLQNTVEHLTKSAPPLQSHTHNSPTTAMRRSDCKDTKLPSTFRNNYNNVFLVDRKKLLEHVRFRFREKNNDFNKTEKKEEVEDIEKDSEVEESPDDDSIEAEEAHNPDDDEENEHEAERINDEEGKKEKKDLENDVNKKDSVFSIQYYLQWCKLFSRN